MENKLKDQIAFRDNAPPSGRAGNAVKCLEWRGSGSRKGSSLHEI